MQWKIKVWLVTGSLRICISTHPALWLHLSRGLIWKSYDHVDISNTKCSRFLTNLTLTLTNPRAGQMEDYLCWILKRVKQDHICHGYFSSEQISVCFQLHTSCRKVSAFCSNIRWSCSISVCSLVVVIMWSIIDSVVITGGIRSRSFPLGLSDFGTCKRTLCRRGVILDVTCSVRRPSQVKQRQN